MKVKRNIQTKKIKDKIMLDKNHLWNIEIKFQIGAGYLKIRDRNNLFLDIHYLHRN